MSETGEIIARLDALINLRTEVRKTYKPVPPQTNVDEVLVAARAFIARQRDADVERLRAECERHYESFRKACAIAEQLRAECERKDAALTPFAEMADALSDDTHDKCSLGLYAHGTLTFGPHAPSVGDLRRARTARAALSVSPTPGEGDGDKIAALDNDDLRPWGWVPGKYFIRCACVGEESRPPIDWPIGDKRSARCENCARKAKEEFRASRQAPAPPTLGEKDGWRDINTHKHTAEEVQLYCDDAEEQFVGYWDDADNGFVYARTSSGRAFICQPSHWRPLFPPPAEEPR